MNFIVRTARKRWQMRELESKEEQNNNNPNCTKENTQQTPLQLLTDEAGGAAMNIISSNYHRSTV